MTNTPPRFSRLHARDDDIDRPGFLDRDILRFFMVDIILVALVKLLLGLGLFPTSDSYVLAMLGSKVVLFAYLIWLIRSRRDAWKETGAASAGRWWAWPLAIILYCAYLPLARVLDLLNRGALTSLYDWLGRVFIPQPQDVVVLVFEDILMVPARIALVAFIVVIGPLMEEFAFRGMGLDAYRRSHGTVTAVLWMSLLFGLYHFSLQLIFPLGVLGAVFALIRLMSGSLWCAFAIHSLHNLVALAVTARNLGLVDLPWFPL